MRVYLENWHFRMVCGSSRQMITELMGKETHFATIYKSWKLTFVGGKYCLKLNFAALHPTKILTIRSMNKHKMLSERKIKDMISLSKCKKNKHIISLIKKTLTVNFFHFCYQDYTSFFLKVLWQINCLWEKKTENCKPNQLQNSYNSAEKNKRKIPSIRTKTTTKRINILALIQVSYFFLFQLHWEVK